jgi:hypothetical protein
MAVPVLIIGKSGSGKSTSMRNCGREFGLINVLGKPLPFKADAENRMGSITTDNIGQIVEILKRAQVNSFIIDDAGYLLTNAFMRGHSNTGAGNDIFKFYNRMADEFWNLVQFVVHGMPPEKIVYFIMHEDKNDSGDIKPKTIGKVLDEKVCVEGMFTIVLRSECVAGDYIFHTRTSGFDVTKTPMGMFDTPTIPNDLKMVDDTIREYYNISTTQGEKTNA